MPTRPLRAKQAAVPPSKDYTHAIAYHSSSITIFWVLFLFLTLGFGMLTLTYYDRLNQQEREIVVLSGQLSETQKSLADVQMKTVMAAKSKPIEVSVTVPPESTTSSIVNTLPAAGAVDAEAYGVLARGALSPDGTKYAGYDDVTKGKIGVGVMTLADRRIRHVVLFNTKTESSGVVISSSIYVVRWLDKNTIQYDVLTSKGKETRTVKIGF